MDAPVRGNSRKYSSKTSETFAGNLGRNHQSKTIVIDATLEKLIREVPKFFFGIPGF